MSSDGTGVVVEAGETRTKGPVYQSLQQKREVMEGVVFECCRVVKMAMTLSPDGVANLKWPR